MWGLIGRRLERKYMSGSRRKKHNCFEGTFVLEYIKYLEDIAIRLARQLHRAGITPRMPLGGDGDQDIALGQHIEEFEWRLLSSSQEP